MEISPDKTVLDYFYHWEQAQPNKTYLRQPFGDEFRDFTWAEVGKQARSIAAYLRSLSLPEKSNIGLVSKNCAEWIICDLAILMSGHVSVPFYATLTAEQLNHVLVHSECRVLFVGKLDDWQGMKSGIPAELPCISFPTYNPDPEHLQWNRILEEYEPTQKPHVPKLEELFTVIYTSGTTGNPKGVMLNYRCMAEVIYHTRHLTKLSVPNPSCFSYLPLSHIAERNIVEVASIISGGMVSFAESLDTFAKNLATTSPSHFLAVPRIWTKFQLGILSKIPQKRLNFVLSIPFIKDFIRKSIKKKLGLGNAEIVLTGAAPMPASLIKWFRKLDINIQEAYGMTENVGAVCLMPSDNIKDGAVGKVYPNMEVKILEGSGEICTRSAWNMMGYYKEPQLTAETIDTEGWIHTGDVGELDAEGYLKITGRVKEMYKTSKGEYVAPAQIEFAFAENTLIEQICVCGHTLPQPIALVVLSEQGKNTDKAELMGDLEEALTKINPNLKPYERIKKIVLMKDAWGVENNMLTPTLKIKRNIIEKTYESQFQKWYEQKDVIIWE